VGKGIMVTGVTARRLLFHEEAPRWQYRLVPSRMAIFWPGRSWPEQD